MHILWYFADKKMMKFFSCICTPFTSVEWFSGYDKRQSRCQHQYVLGQVYNHTKTKFRSHIYISIIPLYLTCKVGRFHYHFNQSRLPISIKSQIWSSNTVTNTGVAPAWLPTVLQLWEEFMEKSADKEMLPFFAFVVCSNHFLSSHFPLEMRWS